MIIQKRFPTSKILLGLVLFLVQSSPQALAQNKLIREILKGDPVRIQRQIDKNAAQSGWTQFKRRVGLKNPLFSPDKRDGNTALHALASIPSSETRFITALLNLGAPIEAKNNLQETPLLVALKSNHQRAVRVLVGSGAEIKEAWSQQEIQLREVLCGDVDFRMEDGQFLLHRAVVYHRFDIAEMLINSGANINAQDHFGNTPLILASGQGDLRFVRMLVKMGADLKLRNMLGFSALEAALEQGHFGIVMALDANGLKGLKLPEVSSLRLLDPFREPEVSDDLIFDAIKADVQIIKKKIPSISYIEDQVRCLQKLNQERSIYLSRAGIYELDVWFSHTPLGAFHLEDSLENRKWRPNASDTPLRLRLNYVHNALIASYLIAKTNHRLEVFFQKGFASSIQCIDARTEYLMDFMRQEGERNSEFLGCSTVDELYQRISHDHFLEMQNKKELQTEESFRAVLSPFVGKSFNGQKLMGSFVDNGIELYRSWGLI